MPKGLNKMAYAFGRAIHNMPERKIYYRYDLTPRKYERATMLDEADQLRWQEIANRAGVGRDFRMGWLREEMAPSDEHKLDFYNELYDSELDDTGYIINDAINKFVSKHMRYVHPDDRYRYNADIRNQMMRRLRSGEDVSDVLDWLEYER